MTIAYHLHFKEPVHFGIEGIGQERLEQTMRSDALWGAILQKWFLLFDDEPDALCRQTPFILSSCFPVINGSRFFPMPIGALDAVLEDAARQDANDEKPTVKEWRKVKYIAEPLFQLVLSGQTPSLDQIDLTQLFPMKQPEKKELNSFYQQVERPRIKTDPLNGGVIEGAFFYCSDQFFQDQCGLFFLADCITDDSREKFEAALRLLGDSGIGADRSVGRGCFSFTSFDIDFQDLKNSSTWLTLSLYHPLKQEVDDGVLNNHASRYSLVRRSGHGGSLHVNRFRRADCWMLEEGAILPFYASGDVSCVLKKSEHIPHSVYRNGRAFCIPFQGGLVE